MAMFIKFEENYPYYVHSDDDNKTFGSSIFLVKKK